MKPALLVVASLLLLVVPAPASDDPPPGRDGNYQFKTFQLESTVWQGRLIPEADIIVRFEPHGVLSYHYSNGFPILQGGSWKQYGDRFYMVTNEKYGEFTAVIRRDRLIGEPHKNIRRFVWTWEMKRQPASAFDPDAGKQPIGNK